MASTDSIIGSTANTGTKAYHILPVRSDEDLAVTKILIYEYTAWLDMDLNYQSFTTEMELFPGKYTPPTGELLLAKSSQGDPLGCVAVRGLSDSICEMKRLFVKDSAKGLGVGKALVQAIVDAARVLGYRSMRLDSLPKMGAALGLYHAMGFVQIDPYYESPFSETRFLELDLSHGIDKTSGEKGT